MPPGEVDLLPLLKGGYKPALKAKLTDGSRLHFWHIVPPQFFPDLR